MRTQTKPAPADLQHVKLVLQSVQLRGRVDVSALCIRVTIVPACCHAITFSQTAIEIVLLPAASLPPVLFVTRIAFESAPLQLDCRYQYSDCVSRAMVPTAANPSCSSSMHCQDRIRSACTAGAAPICRQSQLIRRSQQRNSRQPRRLMPCCGLGTEQALSSVPFPTAGSQSEDHPTLDARRARMRGTYIAIAGRCCFAVPAGAAPAQAYVSRAHTARQPRCLIKTPREHTNCHIARSTVTAGCISTRREFSGLTTSPRAAGRRQEAQQAGGRVLVVEGTPLLGPAAFFAELPLIARVSAGVLLLGAVLFAFQRLRGSGSGCASRLPSVPVLVDTTS